MINCLGRCGSINFKTGVKSTIIAQKGTNILCLCSKKRLIMPWNLCIIQKQAVFIWLLFQLNLNHYDSYRGFYVEDGYTLKLTSKNCRLVFDKLAEGGCAISVFFVEIYIYIYLLETGSLDNAIREFSLAKPSWYMRHYTMIYKNGERKCDFLGLFIFVVVQFSIFWGRF